MLVELPCLCFLGNTEEEDNNSSVSFIMVQRRRIDGCEEDSALDQVAFLVSCVWQY